MNETRNGYNRISECGGNRTAFAVKLFVMGKERRGCPCLPRFGAFSFIFVSCDFCKLKGSSYSV